jgi:hypothetical protein
LQFDRWEERNPNATCLGEFTIDCSADGGKNFESPEFKEVWRTAKRHRHQLTHVLWVNVDRYGRSGIAISWFEKFRDIDIEVNFIDEWFDFRYPESISRFYGRLGDAQAEVMRLGIRTRKGKEGLRERGYYNDSLPRCWKFKEERDADGRKYAYVVEPYFETYRLATIYFNQGLTQAAARRKAHKNTGYMIPKSTFSRFLLSPLPFGQMPIWDRYDIPLHARIMIDMIPCNNVPAMFDNLNMFYSIRDRVKRNAPAGSGEAREAFNEDFPLSYTCPCGCGTKVRGYYANPKRKTPTPYYDCVNCKSESRVHRSKANQFIADMLNAFELKPEYVDAMQKGATRALRDVGKSDSAAIGQFKRNLSDCKQRIAYLEDNIHKYDPDAYNSAFRRLQQQKAKIEAEIRDKEAEAKAGVDVRSQLLGFIGNMGSWFVNDASGHQQARLMAALFPEGYTISKKGFRTWYVNRIFESITTLPDGYEIKTGEDEPFGPHSPGSGRERANIRTIKADVIVLNEFFSYLKNVA